MHIISGGEGFKSPGIKSEFRGKSRIFRRNKAAIIVKSARGPENLKDTKFSHALTINCVQ